MDVPSYRMSECGPLPNSACYACIELIIGIQKSTTSYVRRNDSKVIQPSFYQTFFSVDPILILSFFLHFLVNKVLRPCAPVWADSPIKHSLNTMFLTESALNMLIEDPTESLWAVYSLKVPESSSIPALSHDLSLGSVGTLKLLLLFFENIHEFIDDFLKSL